MFGLDELFEFNHDSILDTAERGEELIYIKELVDSSQEYDEAAFNEFDNDEELNGDTDEEFYDDED